MEYNISDMTEDDNGFFIINKYGVNVAYYKFGYFIRFQLPFGQSIIGDDKFAKLYNIEEKDYLDLMFKKYNGHYVNNAIFKGLCFNERSDCQRAIDEVIHPAILVNILTNI